MSSKIFTLPSILAIPRMYAVSIFALKAMATLLLLPPEISLSNVGKKDTFIEYYVIALTMPKQFTEKLLINERVEEKN
jgi:hypothetical protein